MVEAAKSPKCVGKKKSKSSAFNINSLFISCTRVTNLLDVVLLLKQLDPS